MQSFFGPHSLYCETCAGGAGVLLRKAPSPVEILNDLDSQVVNFFRVLRDPEQRRELIALLELTPYAKEEFLEATATSGDQDASAVERARRLFVRGWQGFGAGNASTDRRVGWGRPTAASLRSEARSWLGGIANLEEVAERLRDVHIEQEDLVNLVQRYDSPRTLFYVDPPYVLSTISGSKPYRHNFTDEDHRRMVAKLDELDAQVVVSGFNSPLYDEILAHWRKEERRALTGARRDGERVTTTEVVWLNRHASAAVIGRS